MFKGFTNAKTKFMPQAINLGNYFLKTQVYDGDCFLPHADENLYNATIVSYFLKNFVISGGKLPRELIDHNLKTDLSWIQRLTRIKENTDAMMDALVFDNSLEYDIKQLVSKFNMRQFFKLDE